MDVVDWLLGSDPAIRWQALVDLTDAPPGEAAAVRARVEHAGERYFDGEVEPCINGRTIGTGVYFGVDVSPIVARILDERLADGGWNCEAENRTSTAAWGSRAAGTRCARSACSTGGTAYRAAGTPARTRPVGPEVELGRPAVAGQLDAVRGVS